MNFLFSHLHESVNHSGLMAKLWKTLLDSFSLYIKLFFLYKYHLKLFIDFNGWFKDWMIWNTAVLSKVLTVLVLFFFFFLKDEDGWMTCVYTVLVLP